VRLKQLIQGFGGLAGGDDKTTFGHTEGQPLAFQGFQKQTVQPDGFGRSQLGGGIQDVHGEIIDPCIKVT
jgi:hypothetical protein